MSNEIRLKRSSTTSVEPVVGDLVLGELAVNTYDGKLFLKKDDGAESIVEILTELSTLPGIGGSITDNQVAVGAATADNIEGASTFTWDATTLTLDSDAGTTLRIEAGAASDARILFYQTFNQRGLLTYDSSETAMSLSCVSGDVKLRPANTDILTLNSATGAQLHNGGLRFLERGANAHTAAATFGELWVRNDAPNVLVFTDDNDTDWVLNTGGVGTAKIVILETEVATTSGTEVTIASGLPSGLRSVYILFEGVGQTGTNNARLQLGDSGGFESSDYDSASTRVGSGGGATNNFSSGGFIFTRTASGDTINGVLHLYCKDVANNTWVASGNFNDDTTAVTFTCSGSKSLSDVLTQIQWDGNGGTLNAGSITVSYINPAFDADSSVTVTGTPVDNQIAVFTAAEVLEGSANLTFDGSNFTITDREVRITSALPTLRLTETDQGLDQKVWEIQATNGDMQHQIFSDDGSSGSYVYWDISRSGTGASVQVDVMTFFAATSVAVQAPTFFTGNMDVTGNITCDAFTSTGIDDNATGERLQIADTTLIVGASGSDYAILNKGTADKLEISGGNATADGAAIIMRGSTDTNASDFVAQADGNVWMEWDESAGDWEISTGAAGAKTTALTIDSSQNATFAGAIAATGNSSVTGAFDIIRTSGAQLALNYDGSNYSTMHVTSTGVLQFGQVGTVKGYEFDGAVTVEGTGIFGENATPDAVLQANDNATTKAALIASVQDNEGTWAYSAINENYTTNLGQGLRLFVSNAGEGRVYAPDDGVTAGGLNFLTDGISALTISNAQNAIFAGDLACTVGFFTSRGIDDNATGERVQISDALLTLGASGASYEIRRSVTDQLLVVSGGNSSSGGTAVYYGGTHATLPGDLHLRSGVNSFLEWDESAGAYYIKTGVGAKTTALTIDASQHATFAGKVIFDASTTADPSFNIPEGVAPTSPVDGDHWLTAAGEYFVRLNGVSVDLAAGGGGGIGGSITDNQIAVGATTADDIEGSASLTFDATSSARLSIGATAPLDSHLSTLEVIEIGIQTVVYGANDTGGSHFARGTHHNGTNWVYTNTEEVSMLSFLSTGDIKLRTAGAGVADATVTFIDALVVDNITGYVTIAQNLNVTGVATFSDDPIITGTSAYMLYVETDAAANNKHWLMGVSGETFTLGVYDDAWSGNTSVMQVSRTANVIDLIAFKADDVTIYSAGTECTLKIGRNASENYAINVTDNNCTITYSQDETSATDHNIVTNIASTTTAERGYIWQSNSTEIAVLDKSGNLQIDGALTLGANSWEIGQGSTEYLDFQSASATVSAFRLYTSTPTLAGYVYANSTLQIGFLNAAGQWAVKCHNSAGTEIMHNANIKFVTSATGVTVTGTGTATEWTATSDIRLKSNLRYITSALDKVEELGGYTFDMKNVDRRMTGVIAQEVLSVLPEAVIENDDGFLTVAQGSMVGLLIEAIKELREEVRSLK